MMNGFDSYDGLLRYVRGLDVPLETLGYAPNGAPIVAARIGGDREPGIVVTAGAHATEHAGVRAAVELLEELETSRAVYVVPSRDPMGLDGYTRTLSQAFEETVSIGSFEDLEELLRSRAEVVYDDDLTLALVGDTGFATTSPPEDTSTCLRLLGRLKEFQYTHPEVMEAFRGRRIIVPAGHSDVEETGDFDRAYTLVVSPDGELLHLNRFYDREWGPVETRCVRRLFETVNPGIVFDLHESSRQGERYHLSLRPPRSGVSREAEEEVGAKIVSAVSNVGIPLATDEDIFNGSLDVVGRSDDSEATQVDNNQFYEKASKGAYWVDPHVTDPARSGEGLNAVDFAADEYGLAYTTETGMLGSFEDRVRAAVVSVQAGVEAFESIQ